MQILWKRFIALTLILSIAYMGIVQLFMPTGVVYAQSQCKVVNSPEPAKIAITHRQTNETGTLIQRRVNGGAWTDLTTLPAKTISFTDGSLTQSTTIDMVYEYQARDFNKDGFTPWSNVGCKLVAMLKDPPLLAPILDVQ